MKGGMRVRPTNDLKLKYGYFCLKTANFLIMETIEPDRITFQRGDIEEHIELTYDEPPPVQKPRRKQRKTREAPPRDQRQNQTQPQKREKKI